MKVFAIIISFGKDELVPLGDALPNLHLQFCIDAKPDCYLKTTSHPLWSMPLTSRIQFADIEQPETVERRVPFKKLRSLRYNAICAQGVVKMLSSFLFIKTEIFI